MQQSIKNDLNKRHILFLETHDNAASRRSRRVLYLKELLRLLELQGVLRSLRLSVVGRLGLVCDESVVWDHDGRREDRGGHEDGVAVDLLHGERRGDDLLLQRVSVWRAGGGNSGTIWTTKQTSVILCGRSGYTHMVWEMPMLHWEGCVVTLLVGTSVCIGWLRSMLQEIIKIC